MIGRMLNDRIRRMLGDEAEHLGVPEGCEVLVAPLDVHIDNNTVLQPDVLVAPPGRTSGS